MKMSVWENTASNKSYLCILKNEFMLANSTEILNQNLARFAQLRLIVHIILKRLKIQN